MWGRLEARRYGVQLPDLRSELGLVSGKLWTEVAQRRRDREFETLTNFVPQLLFSMAGLPPQITFEQRFEILQPALRALKASMLGIQRTSGYRRDNIDNRLDALKEQREEYARLDTIGTDDFSIGAWISGAY